MVTIYVDPPREVGRTPRYKYKYSSHMMTNHDDFAELHQMARAIGLKEEWFQGDHYDVTSNKQRQAKLLGAKEVTTREMIRLCRWNKL